MIKIYKGPYDNQFGPRQARGRMCNPDLNVIDKENLVTLGGYFNNSKYKSKDGSIQYSTEKFLKQIGERKITPGYMLQEKYNQIDLFDNANVQNYSHHNRRQQQNKNRFFR